MCFAYDAVSHERLEKFNKQQWGLAGLCHEHGLQFTLARYRGFESINVTKNTMTFLTGKESRIEMLTLNSTVGIKKAISKYIYRAARNLWTVYLLLLTLFSIQILVQGTKLRYNSESRK